MSSDVIHWCQTEVALAGKEVHGALDGVPCVVLLTLAVQLLSFTFTATTQSLFAKRTFRVFVSGVLS